MLQQSMEDLYLKKSTTLVKLRKVSHELFHLPNFERNIISMNLLAIQPL